MVIAYDGEVPVGQAWGWPLPANSAWWSGLLSIPEEGFTDETGTRTFALSEIMVELDHTGQGIAHLLHDRLLIHRNEDRATLLVEPDNARARNAYLRWGWRPVSHLRPGWDSAPLFDVLIRALPLGRV